MKTTIAKTSLATLAALVFFGLHSPAAPTPSDPLAEAFFPPEMLQQARQEINFTEAQQDWLRRKVEEVSARGQELQQRLQREVEAMAEVIKPDRVDEGKLLAQLDKVLDAERAMKRLQLATLVAIKNQLTSEQQSRLRALRSQLATQAGEAAAQQAELKTRLEGKIKRITAAVQQWQEGGRNTSAVGAIMQEFEPLMKQGKHKEAEAVLDRALSELGIAEAPRTGVQADPDPRPANK